MMQKGNLLVLLVDDDPALIDMHTALLEHHGHAVLSAGDGEQAMVVLNAYYKNIGVVVSDITMPKMDGYELCRRIKESDKTCDIPLIFVSAHTGLEEKMKGYSVGADDYITKPVDDGELSNKIAILLEMRKKEYLLGKQSRDMQARNMQAMSLAGELQQLVNFFDKLLGADDHSQIAQHYLEIMNGLGFISVLEVYCNGKVLGFSQRGVITPLESNLIELAREKEGAADFGARTIANYRNFSLLIKNMPLGDDARYERVKDIIAMIAYAMDAKFECLLKKINPESHNAIISSIKNSLTNIDKLLSGQNENNTAELAEIGLRLHEIVSGLGETRVDGNSHATGIERDLYNIFSQFSSMAVQK